MTREAVILLKVIAANGGTMDKDEAQREANRVAALPYDQFRRWELAISPLIEAHLNRLKHGVDFL